MTPFDPVALVVMLSTFYPSVTLTSLQRAFRERPDYFAGGHLFGRLSDVLVLPDGRAFDIVYAAWTAASRWTAIYLDPNATPGEDPFPLDPGPLVELDVDATVPEPSDPIFESLVAPHVAELHAADGHIGIAALTIAEGGAGAELGDTLGAELAEAQGQHYMHSRALEGELPGELIETMNGHIRQAEYNDLVQGDPNVDAPPDAPTQDPGPKPKPDPDERNI